MLSSLLNFNENKGSLATKSKGDIIENGIRNHKFKNNGNSIESVLISGIAATRIASAGVGKPIKEVVFLVAILNFANRIAEKIGNKKARIAGNKFGFFISD